jgi:membrane-associated HD superfamily phosphohydrolase
MLQSNHFPPDLVEIISQHHGTSIVRYFYEKALDEETGRVDESTFRYHLSKPHRRTAGILMLADSVEATARTLQKPSASLIEQTVNRIVDAKISDGQLEECELTNDDLSKIKKAFTRILVSTYHLRVDYPAGRAGAGAVDNKSDSA